MLFCAYIIKNKISGESTLPFYSQSQVYAIRSFLNYVDNQVSHIPTSRIGDFELYETFNFNTSTGLNHNKEPMIKYLGDYKDFSEKELYKKDINANEHIIEQVLQNSESNNKKA